MHGLREEGCKARERDFIRNDTPRQRCHKRQTFPDPSSSSSSTPLSPPTLPTPRRRISSVICCLKGLEGGDQTLCVARAPGRDFPLQSQCPVLTDDFQSLVDTKLLLGGLLRICTRRRCARSSGAVLPASQNSAPAPRSCAGSCTRQQEERNSLLSKRLGVSLPPSLPPSLSLLSLSLLSLSSLSKN